MADPNYDEQWYNIPASELAEAKDAFLKDGVKGCEKYFNQKLVEWEKIPLDIGIIGESGQGKSSFINAARGLSADDPGGAAVGCNQTTLEPCAYAHPVNENLKFWDLPGLNTPEYTRDNYFEKISFQSYDFFLLVSATRFKDDDRWLAEEIGKLDKKLFFVRSKVHQDVQKDRHDHPKTKDEPNRVDVVLGGITEELIKYLGPLYKRHMNLFLIDNHKPGMYDFGILHERLIADFPVIKRNTLVRSITAINVALLDKKKEVLKKDAYYAAFLSGLVAAAPVPGISLVADFGLIACVSTRWNKDFGLDEASLKSTARKTGTDFGKLKEIVDGGAVAVFLSAQGITGFLRTGSTAALAYITESAAEEVMKYIPILGSVIASGLSAAATYKMFCYILDRMYEVALKVVQAAYMNPGVDEDDDSDAET